MSNPLWSKTALAQAVGLAVVGTGASDALAQDNMSPTFRIATYDLDVNASNLDGKYGTNMGDTKTSNTYKIDLTVPLNTQWDLRLSAQKMNADGTPDEFSYGGPKYSGYSVFSSSENVRLSSNIIDFEAGHHLTLGDQDVRLFAGLRYARINMDLNYNGHVKYSTGGPPVTYDFGYKLSGEIEAYGLRAGAETTVPVSKQFSVSGLLALSALHGEEDYRASYSAYGGSSTLGTESDSHNFYGADAEVALNWDPSPQTEGGPVVSVGYSWSKMKNVSDFLDSDLTEKGMFARLSFPF